ncbi:MAG: DUF805 domain-containing protein [bacterium]|nr:DUF805 domain-containing protein [bacterium]
MFTRLLASPLLTSEGRITRRTFYRYYFPLLFAAIVLETIATFTLSWPLAWLTSTVAIFLVIIITFLVIKRLHDVGKSGYCALLFFVPFANLWAMYLVFFKKGTALKNSSSPVSPSQKNTSAKTKFTALLLALTITASTLSPFLAHTAYAADGSLAGVGQWFNDIGKGVGDTIGKGVDQIKAIAKVNVPGIGVIDLTQFRGVSSIIEKLPAKVDVPIPFTSFSIKYDRSKSPGENIVSNVAPFLSGVVGTLDPMKPGASIARFIIAQAKPLFDQWVKPYIPAAIKNGAHSVKEFIKPLLHAVEDPLVKNFLLPVWEFVVGPIDDLAVDIVNLLAEEVRTGIPLPTNQESDTPQMKFSAPLENQRPVGILEAIDANGVATGWAVDPDDPTRPVTVRFYFAHVTAVRNLRTGNDGFSDAGAPVTANLYRPDVTASTGYSGNHGFSFVIPPQYRISEAGYNFLLSAYAYDTNGRAEDLTKLEGSPKEFPRGLSLVGVLESIDASGKMTGWAFNPNYSGLYQYSRPRVEFYADAPYDGGGRYLSYSEPNKTRKDINLKGIDVVGDSRDATGFREFVDLTRNQIGFEESLDATKFRDGKEHLVYAYAVKSNKLTEKILLAGSPKSFMMPIIYKIGFKHGYPQVARGTTFEQVVLDVPNKEHRMEVLFDDKIVDLNEALHGYPTNLPKDVTYLTVKTEGDGQTRTVPLSIRVPQGISIGVHQVHVRTFGEDVGVTYDGTFSIDVIPYELLSLETPDELVVGTDAVLTLAHIPSEAIFSGYNANMTLEKLTLGGELGAVSIKNYTIGATSNGSAKISFAVPYESGSIRKGRGPVSVDMSVKPKNGASDALMQAVQIWSTDYGRNFSGLTKVGNKPVLGPLCKSSPTPEISFVASTETSDLKAITAAKPFEIGTANLFVEGKGFGCYEQLGISMTAKDGEKILDIIPTKEYTETYGGVVYQTGYKTDEHAYFKFRVLETGWEGAFPKRSGIELVPLDLWNVEHGTVEELLVTVKDAIGHSASAKLPLFTKYTLKVVPGEDAKELKPSGPMRIWWKGFIYGHKVRMLIDNESLRNVTLEKSNLETFEGRELNYIDDLSVPSWITPGEHTLTFEDITELDAKGKVRYRAKATFVVAGAPKKIQKAGAPKIEKQTEETQKETEKTQMVEDTKTFKQQVEDETIKIKENTVEVTTCPTGSTYSFTFKQCTQDVPDKLSPYDGLPCPPAGSVPDYTMRGCIP